MVAPHCLRVGEGSRSARGRQNGLAGDRVRITAQLIEAATDQNLWAESYERELRDVLALQSEVARSIGQQI